MNSKRWVLIIVAIILVVIFVFKKQSDNLINPNFTTPISSPTPHIEQYQFDEKTDLKMELDSINPEVSDSDFEEVK